MSELAELVRNLRGDRRVFLPGSAGEVVGLVDALRAEAAPSLHITASFVPGINPLPFGGLPDVTGLFAQSGMAGAQASGHFRQLVTSYGAYVDDLRAGPGFDTTVVQVAPPDAEGRCSMGLAVEFTPLAISRSRRVIAVINPQMPALAGAVSLHLAEFAAMFTRDAPLREYDVGAPSAQATATAACIAQFVDDGAALQIGLGKVPDALLHQLTDRRRLRLHSGMLSDGVRLLAENCSLDPDFPHTSCVHVGTRGYYDWLADQPNFAVRGCAETHAAGTLAGLDGLVAVNGALSVDLFGQANLEMLGGRAVSGVGGAADFARGARMSRGGISIIALQATAGRGGVSRIVPRLDSVCSIPRHDVDVVVTEHGAADLRQASVMERGQRLIAIAAPQHRETLAAAFHDIARQL